MLSEYDFITTTLARDQIPFRAYPVDESGTFLYYVDTARGRARYSAGGRFINFTEGRHDSEPHSKLMGDVDYVSPTKV